MAERTYSEQRQAAYFRAARELRKLAGSILDEVTQPAELTGRTAAWAKNQAATTARKANELEDLGYAETITSARTDVPNVKSRAAYGKAIDRFEQRLADHGVDPSRVVAEAERYAWQRPS